jgi:hypothetical protein
MPIATFDPIPDEQTDIDLPRVEPAVYKSIINDDRYQPLQGLISYVEGAPWSVNYYNQILTQHTDLRELDVNQAAIYQQYSKIINLEIRVTDQLTESQDQISGLITVQGSGIIYPFLTPNANDYFVASVGDGKDGLFRITQVDRKSHHKNSVFSAEYVLIAFLGDNDPRYLNLEQKTTNSVYFNKDRLIEGLQPTLVTSEHNTALFLKDFFHQCCEFYFSNFVSKDYGTIIIPKQIKTIYDPFLVNFLLKITETSDAKEIATISQLNMEQLKRLTEPQLWSLLLNSNNLSATLLSGCNSSMGILQNSFFSTNPVMSSFRFSRFYGMVYPTRRVPEDPFEKSFPIPPVLFNSIIEERGTNPISTVLIKPVLIDNFYVLSEAFYTKTPPLSLLETLVLNHLQNKAIPTADVKKLCDDYLNWGLLEQFYYLPILMLLIKVTVSGLY